MSNDHTLAMLTGEIEGEREGRGDAHGFDGDVKQAVLASPTATSCALTV